MEDPWWSLVAAGMAVMAAHALRARAKKRRAEERKLQSGREKSSEEMLVCERVCASKRMLGKLAAISKDPVSETCVTVCAVSQLEACAEACARAVCVSHRQVPNWNDDCLRRCQSECLKLSASRSS